MNQHEEEDESLCRFSLGRNQESIVHGRSVLLWLLE